MKQFDRFARIGSPSRGGRAPWMLAAFALGFGVLSAFAGGPQTSGGGGGDLGAPTFSGGGGDDETVGTLPVFDGGQTLDVLRFAREQRPSLYVQGPIDVVLSAAVEVRGDRRVLAQPMSNGELRLIFLGDTRVGFSRESFDLGNLRFGIATAEGSTVLRTGALWNGQSIGGFVRTHELPVAAFESNGLLDLAPLQAGMSTTHGSTTVAAHATSAVVTLTQIR